MLKGLAITPPVIGRISIGRVVERAWSYEESWASLRADLNALADGTKQPSDFMNAAVHYMRASAAAMQLRVDEQDDKADKAKPFNLLYWLVDQLMG